MKYFAPFSSKWNYWMVSFDDSNLNLVKLSIKSSLKFALNEQLGLFSFFINDIKNNDLNIVLRKQKHFKFKINEDLKIKLVKNKIFGEILTITTEDSKYNLQIRNGVNKEKLFLEFEKKLKKTWIA